MEFTLSTLYSGPDGPTVSLAHVTSALSRIVGQVERVGDSHLTAVGLLRAEVAELEALAAEAEAARDEP